MRRVSSQLSKAQKRILQLEDDLKILARLDQDDRDKLLFELVGGFEHRQDINVSVTRDPAAPDEEEPGEDSCPPPHILCLKCVGCSMLST